MTKVSCIPVQIKYNLSAWIFDFPYFSSYFTEENIDKSVNYNNFINKDFRSLSQTSKSQRHPALRWALFAAGCAVIGAVIANTGSNENNNITVNHDTSTEQTSEATAPNASEKPTSIQLNLPLPSSVQKSSEHIEPKLDTTVDNSSAMKYNDPENPEWKVLKVKRGDSLSVLFDRAKVKPNQLLALMKLGKATKELRRIHPGDSVKIMSNEQWQLIALNYQIDTESYQQVEREGDKLVAGLHKHEIEVRNAYASGEIESSLFLASEKAGLSQSLIMELANIFGWDIDFALDIRKGDQFTVIYEERFKNGNKIKDGNILAAEFINQNKTHRALRYTDPVTGNAGYYSDEGHSLRKAFLRSPVNFSRISSRFTTKRYHPILHKFRSHKGVDYAAGRGTPVRASGDGKVIFKGRKGGYGKTIVLKHGSRYTTLYAHLNNFNKKIRSGGRVKQGQIIGYVGSTGLASGPHLHYEFRVNGVHRNPLTVKFPSTSPIPKRYRDNFELSTQGYVAQLKVLSRNALALNDKQ